VTFSVSIQPRAERDLDEICGWISDRAPGAAIRWLDGLLDAVETLASFPLRCPLASESGACPVEIRQLIYGSYRLLFTVDGHHVRVLHVRHSSRQAVQPGELTVDY
jgi:plasmid stabilization system protein ParE